MKLFQKGFNYSQDGPGNRLVYHLQGCNLRCAWCANPESLSLDAPGCVNRTVESLLNEALSCRMMFFDGGGVTFTGGEPTAQFDGLGELLDRLKAEGIDTAVETNGSHPRLPALFPSIDHLMLDVKCVDSVTHRRLTGSDNRIILENAARALAEHPDTRIRTPLVWGLNASEADIKALIDWAAAIPKRNASFELLPYHEYGRDKWLKLGLDYRVEGGYLPPGALNAYEEQMRARGLHVVRS